MNTGSMSGDRPDRGVARVSRFARPVRGQSETIGVVLILAIVAIGSSAVIVYGSAALGDVESQSQLERAEHAMTLLDSHTAMVALGDSNAQSVDVGGGGEYSVREGGGWLRVRHANYTGNGDSETIYNQSLGAVEYDVGGVTLAYQGGGVWRTQDDGSVMVSPPEFHYRDETLTLPIVQVTGTGGGSDGDTTYVTSDGRTKRVFPNLTASETEGGEVGAPYDVNDRTYRNPLESGTVNVTVHSEYYEGWADYFRTRTDGNVTVDPAGETATVELVTVTTNGEFDLSSPSVTVRGMADGHNVESFSTTVARGGKKQHSFSFWAESGSRKLELDIYAKMACKKDAPVLVSIYYHDVDTTHKWRRNIDPDSDSALDLDCGNDTISVNFLAASNLTYGEIDGAYEGTKSGDDAWHFDPTAHTMDDTATLDQHTADTDPTTFGKGDEASLQRLTKHYLSLMGSDVKLIASTKHGELDRSYGTLTYEQGGGKYITFLHITENEIRVE